MTQVVKSFENNGILFDIYADGDCVMKTVKSGFIQISAEVLNRIMSKTKSSDSPQTAPARAVTQEPKKDQPTEQKLGKILTPFEEAAASKKSPKEHVIQQSKQSSSAFGEVKRRIIKPEERAGWECAFVVNGKVIESHIYTKRSEARAAIQGTEIGVNGRIE